MSRDVRQSVGRNLPQAVFVALFFSAILLIRSPRPAFAGSSIATAPTTTGRVLVYHGDDETMQSLGGPLVLLRTDDGQTIRLAPNAAAGQTLNDLLAHEGERVAVSGSIERGTVATAEPTLTAGSLTTLETAATDAATATLAAASGPWVSLACRFADTTATMLPLSHYEGMYRTAFPSLSDYWRTAAGGALDLTGSAAAGWYTLPGTRDSYLLTTTVPNFDKIVADCAALADADVDFSAYYGINLFLSDSIGGQAWGGRPELTLDGATRLFGVTWLPLSTHTVMTTVAHEMGHGYGLPHSGTSTGLEYRNPWDVMGNSRADCQTLVDPTYGCVAQLPAGYYLDRAGLLPNASIYTATSGTQTITLGAPGAAAGYGLAYIPVSGDANRFFVVEARAQSGYDSRLPAAAVVIYDVDLTRTTALAWLAGDYTVNGSATDSAWVTGEVYVAPVGQISVEVVRAVTGGFEVKLRKDTPYTPPAPPTPPTPLTFGAVHDGYVASTLLTRSYGTSTALRVKDTSTTDFITYLKFDVKGLSAKPAAAKLRLYVIDTGTDGGGLYRVANEARSSTAAWTETSLTFKTAPALGATSFARIGTVATKGWVEVDVTSQISGNGVFSFAIRNASSNVVGYGSSESTTPPQLIVTPTS